MISEKIRTAWNLRLAQSWEDFRRLLAELKSEMKLPMGPVNETQILNLANNYDAETLPVVVEILLLSISVLRAEGATQECERAFEALQKVIQAKSLAPSFHFHFQRALNEMSRGDSSSALENFLASRMYTEDPTEKLLATTNALFCLDNLGLPFEKTYAEVTELLKTFKTEHGVVASCAEQVRQFRQRQNLRNGDIGLVAKDKPGATFGQFDYFKAWTLSLPYHKHHVALNQMDMEQFSLTNPYFFKKGFRLRTLQGLIHPSDTVGSNATEIADRLYLWTWKWLSNPDEFPLSKVMKILNELDLQKLSPHLTDEDYFLLRNSLAWMGLFDPVNQSRIDQVVFQLRNVGSRPLPLWSFESELLDYLFARRDRRFDEAATLLSQLQSRPLWNSSEILLGDVVRALDHEETKILSHLVKSLKTLMTDKSDNVKPKSLIVDLIKDQVIPKSGAVINSQPLARSLDLLYKRGSVNCSEFLLVAFGISGYEPLIHDQKIFNLLARIRQLNLRDLNFGVKSGKVFGSGSWAEIEIRHPQESQRHLHRHIEWQTLLEFKIGARDRAEEKVQKWIKPALLMKKLAGKTEFRREDLEILAGTSRSTANRLLKAWEDEGVVSRRGNARNVVYYFSERSQRKNYEQEL